MHILLVIGYPLFYMSCVYRYGIEMEEERLAALKLEEEERKRHKWLADS
jgi:hypothetical protein